jgi:hypothetical protein
MTVPPILCSMRLLVAVVAFAVAASSLPAQTTGGRTFVPGDSLGGVRVGMTKAEVLGKWGKRHGVCRGCPRLTWYFNERPFEPQGTGVVFARGRVVHAFTVWQPSRWSSTNGLELGDDEGKVAESGLVVDERECAGYEALVSRGRRGDGVLYVFRGRLWGFGLIRPGEDPCL